jgi:hypothetical protein
MSNVMDGLPINLSNLQYDLRGSLGNGYAVQGEVKDFLKQCGREDAAKEFVRRLDISNDKSYEQLLRIVSEFITFDWIMPDGLDLPELKLPPKYYDLTVDSWTVAMDIMGILTAKNVQFQITPRTGPQGYCIQVATKHQMTLDKAFTQAQETQDENL